MNTDSFFVEPSGLAELALDFDGAWRELEGSISFASPLERDAARDELARLIISMHKDNPAMPVLTRNAVVDAYLRSAGART